MVNKDFPYGHNVNDKTENVVSVSPDVLLIICCHGNAVSCIVSLCIGVSLTGDTSSRVLFSRTLPHLMATLLPSTTTGRRLSLSSGSWDGLSSRQESREDREAEE